jgi:hypothetical protein
MMSQVDEDSSVHNSTDDLEIFIARPTAQVWRQCIDAASWVTSHHVENVRGAPGALGSITRVSFKRARELGMPLPHYHYCKVIQLVPERQYVLKAYSERGGSYGVCLTGFDDTRFFSVDGGTKITFRAYSEYKGELVTNEPSALKDAEEDNHMLQNLENLKRIVESQTGHEG